MGFNILGHIGMILVTIIVIWFFGGKLVDSVSRISRKMNQSGFTTALFILGLLTSVSEISVMINSSISGTPQVSAGNVTGASIMLFLCIIPFLAIFGKNGITMKDTLPKSQLIISLITIALPPIFLFDGRASIFEGFLCLVAYATLFTIVRRTPKKIIEKVDDTVETIIHPEVSLPREIGKILLGVVVIFFAGDILVSEANTIADIFSVPKSLIGLLLLSVGTNIPELVVAIRAVTKHRSDIAFGGYVGSALTNTLSFGILVLINRGFQVTASQFIITAIILTIGLILFYIFAQSKNTLSRTEGIILLGLYVVFMAIQTLFLVSVLLK